ncbi:type II secretion system protein [Gordoniibacillus kamchatkensis]|uniref:Type II secretion system protein n=1 Tax=Gordoniibacillus kamchatkensis TaxID=1590651 RepID=A0ABR5AN67_9BACL|nr:type II secretion system F family protein [Paenibacillus sp. VKM B-2647]KIL42464.1 type II secretion system protein [Paenibacillus sp. VKM B-2647]
MPRFRYVAVDAKGNYSRGRLDAPTLTLAMEEIKRRGLWIIDLFDPGESILYKEIHLGGPKVKSDHFVAFCRQLSTMYKSGIHIVEAVRILGEHSESKAFRKILRSIYEEMASGTPFSTAVAQYPDVFSDVFVNMVRAGEVSGKLDDMLNRLAFFHEKEHYTKEKVKSAMIYPAAVSVVTVIVVTILMTFVVPRFVSNFQAMDMELPLPTKIVIAISGWMKRFWYLLPVIVAGLALLLRWIRGTAKGAYYLDLAKLKMPVFGKLWHKRALSRFSRTFCSLFAASIPMPRIMTILSAVVSNEAMAKLIRESREAVSSGDSLAEPFKDSWLFPPMVVQMLAAGESSGEIDSMMEKVADYFENDVDTMADRLKSLLEPLMIVLLAGIVGLIVLAVMLPSFTMINNMHA